MVNIKDEIEHNFSFLKEYEFIFDIPQSITNDCIIAIFKTSSLKIKLVKGGHRNDLHMELSNMEEDKWVSFHWFLKYFSNDDEYDINLHFDEKSQDIKIRHQMISISEELKKFIVKLIHFYVSKDYKENYKKLKNYIYIWCERRGLLATRKRKHKMRHFKLLEKIKDIIYR
jgi:hypothetical protein